MLWAWLVAFVMKSQVTGQKYSEIEDFDIYISSLFRRQFRFCLETIMQFNHGKRNLNRPQHLKNGRKQLINWTGKLIPKFNSILNVILFLG